MKIFYAVQATGNGHISRAMTLLPYLQQYGSVDIFLSGENSHLRLDAPVKYRSRGISLFYTCTGGLNYWKMVRKTDPARVFREIRDLPVEKYDIVINDFDYITSAACARKKKTSIHFGHQAAFQSPHTPRPASGNILGEWLLRNYVKATYHVGLHFKQYDRFIFPPVIKKEILEAEPADRGYYTVYLPSYCDAELFKILSPFTNCRFQVFSRETTVPGKTGSISFMPVTKEAFNESLINCSGIITGAGFETPAEALHLGKKILAIPIRGQYEQYCNAAALQEMGVQCLSKFDGNFVTHFQKWIEAPVPDRADYNNVIPDCLEMVLELAGTQLPKNAFAVI